MAALLVGIAGALTKAAIVCGDADLLDISVRRDPDPRARGSRSGECGSGAGPGGFPAACAPGRPALAQLRASTLIYISTRTGELSLALAEPHPPKHMQALALGYIGKVQTPHQHTYTYKTCYKASLYQTFSLLLLCILTPDNPKAQAASLLRVYMTELWLMYGSRGSLRGAAAGRSATVWASETAEAA